jgi:hypothetical protein
MYPYLDLARAWMEEAERRAQDHARIRRARPYARRRRRRNATWGWLTAGGRQRSGTPGRAMDSGGTYDAAVKATPTPTRRAPLSRSTPR